jgi:hypothetical protein
MIRDAAVFYSEMQEKHALGDILKSSFQKQTKYISNPTTNKKVRKKLQLTQNIFMSKSAKPHEALTSCLGSANSEN